MNRIGSAVAPLANALLAAGPVRALAERFAGIDRRRPLPRFRRDTLPAWHARRRAGDAAAATRGPVIFLADSFTSYTEPDIGRAAITLLERAGHEVILAHNVCCGRALISKGLLKQAKALHARLIERLAAPAAEGVPIVGVEPSCVLALRDEVPALAAGDQRAVVIARQATLVDDILVRAIDDGALAMPAAGRARRILFHPHCHQKAASATASSVALLERIPGAEVTTLDAGCCGMAGSFGFEKRHYDLSMRIGGMRLFPAIQGSRDAEVAATGVSCRQQIAHGTGRVARHPVVVLAEAIGQG